ncbi:MAG: metallophosphoesterase, partial [Myxococcales bacterium]
MVTDRTGGPRDGIFESAMPRINLVRPEFVVSVGDLIEGYTDDPAVIGK